MKTYSILPGIQILAPCLGSILAIATTAEAGSRRFTYSYETTTMAQGAMELES